MSSKMTSNKSKFRVSAWCGNSRLEWHYDDLAKAKDKRIELLMTLPVAWEIELKEVTV